MSRLRRLRLPSTDGAVVGALVPIDPDADHRGRHVLRLAEQVTREHGALCSYLADAERAAAHAGDAGRLDSAAHYDRQASTSLSISADLRALWAGEMGLPLTLAESLLRTLETLVDQLRQYESTEPLRGAQH